MVGMGWGKYGLTRRCVRDGNVLVEIQGRLRQPVLRYHIARKLCAYVAAAGGIGHGRQRIEDPVQAGRAEVAFSLSKRGDGVVEDLARSPPLALVTDEEKRLVSAVVKSRDHDRTAQRAAELMTC